jgi:hypothetical protein
LIYFYEITDILAFAKHDSFLKDVIPIMSIIFLLRLAMKSQGWGSDTVRVGCTTNIVRAGGL